MHSFLVKNVVKKYLLRVEGYDSQNKKWCYVKLEHLLKAGCKTLYNKNDQSCMYDDYYNEITNTPTRCDLTLWDFLKAELSPAKIKVRGGEFLHNSLI